MRRISVEQVQSSERFYRVPKVFVESIYYRKLSTESKFTYAILKDRFELSLKNNWIDENGDVYLIFTVEELQSILGFGNKKVIKIKKQLAEYGLLEEVRQGLNKPNRLYLGNVISDSKILKSEFVSHKPLVEAEVSKRHFQKCQNDTSRNVKTTSQKVSKRHANDTDISDTNNSEYSSSRKSEEISDEIPLSPKTQFSLTRSNSQKYIPPKYYSLLQTIADCYNGKFCQIDLFTGQSQNFTLTHKQKMMIGKYLDDNWVTSQEVLDLIDRIPFDCRSPLAYLLKGLENLKEERRIEAKNIAHLNAERYYRGDKV
ncbi:replication initiator protein A [Streptococcus suis]|uniref:replication initiator protein A n=1 Tax=Streptococcus suis TaxID=1307 RepID=UPI001ABDB7CF|nr:replication initiator protein A [Streptococcus suis]